MRVLTVRLRDFVSAVQLNSYEGLVPSDNQEYTDTADTSVS